MKRIDAHLHFSGDDPHALALLEELNLKLVNIDVAHDPEGRWRERSRFRRDLAQRYPARYAWVTSFDPFGFDKPGYVDRQIEQIERDLEAGAIGVKIWKNVGMEVKDADGQYVMVDDPVYKPILRHLEQHGIPLLTHIAEPMACWRPLDPSSPHYKYFSRNPQWHMYNRPDCPSHEQLMAARDHVSERHPELNMIGAHLGSLEYSLEEIARRLRRYPNFAMDTSARTVDLMRHDSSQVRELFLEFPDRLIFGTDIVKPQPTSSMTPQQRDETLDLYRQLCLGEFAYYESSGPVTVRGWEAQGLNLPADVLEQFYVTNAMKWYPTLTLHAEDQSGAPS